MHPKRFLYIFLLLSFFGFELKAQENESYRNETLFGVNLNTNGGLIGGIMARHSRRITPGRYLNFGLEIVQVKHPNEVRFSGSNSGSVYILGKKNYLIAFRPQIGFEWILFNKGREDGVQVDAIINLGPSIGVVKPYYIQYDIGGESVIVAYDEKVHNIANIISGAGFFQGIRGTTIAPGLHAKAGLSFEFSTFGSNVSGIEAGVSVEAYTQTIELMQIYSFPRTYNRRSFSSLYLNIYFGGRR